jgi:hypothetical protein
MAQFVVTRGDPAEVFHLVEKALDAIAPPVAFLVVGWFLAARTLGRDDRFNAIEGQPFTDAIGIVAFIESRGLQNIVRVEALIKRLKLPAVMGFSRGQMQSYGAVFVDRRRVDFGGVAPARASQSLVCTVFFGAPAACWCARTVVESKRRSRA